METNLTDSELIQAILSKNDWTQQELAQHLKFDRAQISRAIYGKVRLRPLTREKAEQLLAEAEAEASESK